jgi:hypothetical protein
MILLTVACTPKSHALFWHFVRIVHFLHQNTGQPSSSSSGASLPGCIPVTDATTVLKNCRGENMPPPPSRHSGALLTLDKLRHKKTLWVVGVHGYCL